MCHMSSEVNSTTKNKLISLAKERKLDYDLIELLTLEAPNGSHFDTLVLLIKNEITKLEKQFN
ncbi:hypothetical protein BpHYR1_041466 [Brachionus plicatilis]|uniref:Uncharacterized protein n=1 Tax=Brachionus plicatilis TaxID=10195 RepID=A0A3M7S2L7_BRAPC|nr:hypothetical protein BpHYR1_041466 [Brachionus plicatilis]